MEITRDKNQLTVKLRRDFNLYTSTRVKQLSIDVDNVLIDLSNSKIIDSEAIRVLYELVSDGKRVELRRPPELIHELVDVLGLGEFFDLERMIVSKRGPAPKE